MQTTPGRDRVARPGRHLPLPRHDEPAPARRPRPDASVAVAAADGAAATTAADRGYPDAGSAGRATRSHCDCCDPWSAGRSRRSSWTGRRQRSSGGHHHGSRRPGRPCPLVHRGRVPRSRADRSRVCRGSDVAYVCSRTRSSRSACHRGCTCRRRGRSPASGRRGRCPRSSGGTENASGDNGTEPTESTHPAGGGGTTQAQTGGGNTEWNSSEPSATPSGAGTGTSGTAVRGGTGSGIRADPRQWYWRSRHPAMAAVAAQASWNAFDRRQVVRAAHPAGGDRWDSVLRRRPMAAARRPAGTTGSSEQHPAADSGAAHHGATQHPASGGSGSGTSGGGTGGGGSGGSGNSGTSGSRAPSGIFRTIRSVSTPALRARERLSILARMSTPQNPSQRYREKARRTKQLAEWRAKQTAKAALPKAEGAACQEGYREVTAARLVRGGGRLADHVEPERRRGAFALSRRIPHAAQLGPSDLAFARRDATART